MNSIKHYKHFPCMKPWIGDKYLSPLHKRLLLVGESHYFPKASTIHLDADSWYQREQSELSEKERKWLSTSGIIKNNKEHNFPKKAHGIYKNTCSVINSCSFKYAQPSKVIEHYAYYNFFQRPAEVTGESINVKEIDKEVASAVFQSIIEKLNPELIIFTSALAGKIGGRLAQAEGIAFVVTPHPTCAWWNRTAKKYNGKGRELIPSFLNKYKWMA